MTSGSTKVNVRYQETDRMGIVYHSNYFIWFEIGRTELFKKAGISYSDLEKDGYFLIVAEANCKYKSPVTYDEELEIVTQLSELKKSTLAFNYEVRKGDRLVASGATRHAFVNKDGKLVKIPAIAVEALKVSVKNCR